MGFLSSFAGNLTGGLIGTSDAEAAAGNVDRISEEAKKETMAEYDQSWGDISSYLTPYIQSGREASSQFRQNIGAAPDAPIFDNFNFNFDDYQNSDAFKFLMDQSQQAVDRMSAKNRSLTSGNRLMDTTRYMQGVAGQAYGDEFSRQLQGSQFNRGSQAMTYDAARGRWGDQQNAYGQIMGQGFSAANNLGSFRQNLANSRSNTIANRTAESTAAQLIPAQEKMAFVNNLIASGGNAAGGAIAASDMRLKHDIEYLGTTESGINIYEYAYIGSDERVIGVMAQEVKEIIPEAVMVMDNGYYAVDYSRLH